ncbi:hypothetical protein KP509_01G029600 [Ceratopteris richardii]|uniref:Major facilitator superfamily (MFS) profile domain-containing protein n=1 Tax=Ceratopteris richardii TaxID=49495 RepID=A0A8T2VK46_CERRI|nr:hypothetical protein KP509_01G029600 [Ceratopteris richardii]
MREKKGGDQNEEKITGLVILSSIVAATSGLVVGYNIGISGGVASMDSFLLYFFASVYERKQEASESNYCKFDDPLLQTFTSSLYIAGLLATFVSVQTTQKLGRKPTILIAGLFYLIGVCLVALAQNISMLMIGRIMLGFGSGFVGQVP